MERSLRLSYRYHDTDLVELAAFVWNGAFAGSTRLYISHGDLADAADVLAGFPMDLKDAREVTIGAFGSESGGGAIALSLVCADGAGHCKLQLRLESDPLISEIASGTGRVVRCLRASSIRPLRGGDEDVELVVEGLLSAAVDLNRCIRDE